jgi:hypothetical protein
MFPDSPVKQLADILTITDYEQERSPDELYEWAYIKNSELSEWAHSSSRTKNDRATKHRELSKGLPNKFANEALPLSYFAEKYYGGRKDLLFKLYSGRQSYDAKLTSQNQRLSTKIEITNAIKGHIWALQKELLVEKGWAPGEQDIKGVRDHKPKHQRTVEDIQLTIGLHSVSKQLAETSRLIECVTNKKIEKSRQPKKPYGVKQTLLLVTFNDTGFEHMRDRILEFKHSKIDTREHNFEKIILFGWNSKTFYE